jgi:hypothetical protein
VLSYPNPINPAEYQQFNRMLVTRVMDHGVTA